MKIFERKLKKPRMIEEIFMDHIHLCLVKMKSWSLKWISWSRTSQSKVIIFKVDLKNMKVDFFGFKSCQKWIVTTFILKLNIHEVSYKWYCICVNSFKTHFESELHLKKIQTEQGSMECPQQWKFYVQFLDQTLSRSIVVESNNRQIAQVRDSRTEYPF